MAAVASEPPPSILARVDRLDIMLGYLEELRGSRGSTSTATTTTTTSGGGAVAPSEGGNSSVNSSPMSVDLRRCRPIGDVVVETQVKGSLIDRVQHLEIRLLKLENEMGIAEEKKNSKQRKGEEEKKARKGRGLKRLVESCVRGDLKTKE